MKMINTKNIFILVIMRYILGILLVLIIFQLSSCRKDFSTELSKGNLEFSKDTVYLDTVFTNIGSSTYRLKVYNRENNAVTIPVIQLGNGMDSGYRLNVDGVSGKYFENVDVLAKDSLFIFIETTLDYSQISDPLYIDDLLFDQGSNQQVVKLVTLVQDAHFLYPAQENGIIETLVIDGEQTEIQGRYLTNDELTFTNEKPYVIYGYMAVGDAENAPKTLTVEAGAQVHFHANSGLIVNPNSSLHINGTLNIEGLPVTEVMIQGDRLEPDYEEVPGQWGVIWLREGSIDNRISYATIKNGGVGLLVDGYLDEMTPVLEMNNTQFYNHSQFGVLGRNTNIKGHNLVFNNFGLSAFAGTQGGVYEFTHCTFANYWNGGVRSLPTVLVNNFYTEDNENYTVFDLQKADFTNNIIYGTNQVEFLLEKVEGAAFNFNFKNNLLKFNDASGNLTSLPEYDFSNNTYYSDNIFNETPDFFDTSLNQMQVGENTGGLGHALPSATAQYPIDIVGTSRANPADIGAYEHIIFD
jgi:hypothetical protein